MNVIFFTGNVGKDAELRDVRGDKVCNFSVAVKQGYGKDAPTAWYRVEVWGKRGESLAQYVRKGGKVAVTGEFIIDEYEGKPQYRVRASDVDPFMGGKQDDRPRSQGNEQNSSAFDDDFSDSVPF